MGLGFRSEEFDRHHDLSDVSEAPRPSRPPAPPPIGEFAPVEQLAHLETTAKR